MTEPNYLLRAARERLPSACAPGDHASRAEVAEAVNVWLWENTGKRYELDAHYLAKLERGVARWPGAAYRSGLRHVLGVADDNALGFVPPRRADTTMLVAPTEAPGAWRTGGLIQRVLAMTQHDLMSQTRCTVLAGTALLTGHTLAAELRSLLWPVAADPMHRSSAFAPSELEATAQLVGELRAWRSRSSALSRATVVAQLDAHTERLRHAPQGTPETLRGFRLGAELAEIAASMAWDAAEQVAAQRYYLLAAQLAHASDDENLAAAVLAALARQCYDLGRPADGLEVTQLAQYGTRRSATPRLRAVLATREAWAYARHGDARAFRRAVDLAEDHYAEGVRDADAGMPTARSLDDAELAGVIGARYRDLARFDVRHARTAQDYIGRALALRHPSRPRNRAFDLIGLARAHLITREPDRAAELIGEAVPLAGNWVPGRVGVKLRDFHTEAAPFATVPEVRHIREAVAELIAI